MDLKLEDHGLCPGVGPGSCGSGVSRKMGNPDPQEGPRIPKIEVRASCLFSSFFLKKNWVSVFLIEYPLWV